jgi:hypothetical protein
VSLPTLLAAEGGSSAESLFAVRAANQLLVAAIACLTVDRPLSSLPFGTGAALAGWSESSAESGTSEASGAPEASEASAEEVLDLPIWSAGRGTGGWLAEACPFASRSAPWSPPRFTLPVSTLLRDELITSFSAVASTVPSSGSISRPDGATIRDGSVARPALSTPSSSVTTGPLLLSAEPIRPRAIRPSCRKSGCGTPGPPCRR